jgi:hypothetical protein
VGKPERKRPLGKPSTMRWLDLGEIGWGGVDWIALAQNRDQWRALVNAIMNILVPEIAGKVSSGLTTDGLSSSAHQFHRVNCRRKLNVGGTNKTEGLETEH